MFLGDISMTNILLLEKLPARGMWWYNFEDVEYFPHHIYRLTRLAFFHHICK